MSPYLARLGVAGQVAHRELLRAAADRDHGVRIAAARALADIGDVRGALPGLTEGLRDDNASIRQQSAYQLEAVTKELGSDADVTIPALIDALDDEQLSSMAAIALANIGPEAMPALVEALHSPNPRMRESARWTLIYPLAPKLQPAIPVLLTAANSPESPAILIEKIQTQDTDGRAWGGICAALGRIGPAAVPSLTRALDDPAPAVRLCAVLAFTEMGVPSQAVPAVEARLRDADATIQTTAQAALKRAAPGRTKSE